MSKEVFKLKGSVEIDTNDVTKALKSIQDEAEKTVDSFEDMERESKSIKDSFDDLDSTTKFFGMDTLSGVTDKVMDFASSLMEIPEATEELRMGIAKVDASVKSNGHSVEEAHQQYKELYGYLKDDMAVTNVITNLSQLKVKQEDLNTTLESCVAVWTAYGDSIPIEGLSESIVETANVGKVTGNLADALNWASISEDDFNTKLEKLKTTEERLALINSTLNGTYGETKKIYDESTISSRELAEQQHELAMKQAELSPYIESVSTRFETLKLNMLQGLMPVIQGVLGVLTTLLDMFSALPQPVQNLISIVVSLGSVFLVLVTIGAKLYTAFQILAPIFTGVGVAIGGISAPVVLTVGAITGLIAIGVKLMKNWGQLGREAKSKWSGIGQSMVNGIKTAFNGISELCGKIANKVRNTWNKVTSVFTGSFSVSTGKVSKHAKGGIMTKETLMGFDSRGTAHIGGEAGDEAILPLNPFYNYMDQQIARMRSNIDYDKLTESIIKAQRKVNQGIYINGNLVGVQTASSVNRQTQRENKRLERLGGLASV